MSSSKIKISNLPIRGCNDWLPDEFRIRYYIFQVWRRVCESFGYQEYLTPILENADIYRMKSGDELASKELMIIHKEECDLAIRPEMTPSVTRMVTKVYNNTPKPLRLFSIANFYRYQKPQKGRNREFWQLNCDIFGSDSVYADFEILQLAIEILKAFGATNEHFVVLINHRQFIQYILTKKYKTPESCVNDAISIIDKIDKLPIDETKSNLVKLGIQNENIQDLLKFIIDNYDNEYESNKYILEYTEETNDSNFLELLKLVKSSEYNNYIKFTPKLVRGLAYYDGLVFEIFDKRVIESIKKDNEKIVSRSIFGGGRYNGLSSIFGISSIPAVGFAPGDETTKLFLESYNLLNISTNLNEDTYYLPIIDKNLINEVFMLANKIRFTGKKVALGTNVESISKALNNASKHKYKYIIIFGTEEQTKSQYKIKNLNTGEEKVYTI